jgi:hypothetical protein
MDMKKFYAKPVNGLYLIASVVVMSFLVSCSSSNQLASSFGKRKYTKGYFFDIPGKQNAVASGKTENKNNNSEKTKVVLSGNTNGTSVVLNTATVISANKAPTKPVHNYPLHKLVTIASTSRQASTEATNLKGYRKENIISAYETKIVSDNTQGIAAIGTYHHGEDPGYCKSWAVALLLCIFLGLLGIHRFYLGYPGLGVLEIFTFGCYGVLWLIDLIRIIIKDLGPRDGTYC